MFPYLKNYPLRFPHRSKVFFSHKIGIIHSLNNHYYTLVEEKKSCFFKQNVSFLDSLTVLGGRNVCINSPGAPFPDFLPNVSVCERRTPKSNTDSIIMHKQMLFSPLLGRRGKKAPLKNECQHDVLWVKDFKVSFSL